LPSAKSAGIPVYETMHEMTSFGNRPERTAWVAALAGLVPLGQTLTSRMLVRRLPVTKGSDTGAPH
jgi:hypothetical protein